MLVCGDYRNHGFPSVGSPNYQQPNSYYPSGPPTDYRPNSNYQPNYNYQTTTPYPPNYDVHKHGFPSVNGGGFIGDRNPTPTPNPDPRGPNFQGYPQTDPTGNVYYTRDPYPDPHFGGSGSNRPSYPIPNYNGIGERFGGDSTSTPSGYPQFNRPQIQQVAGFPIFNTITAGLSRFGTFNSNRPIGNGPYGGNQYPNSYPNSYPNRYQNSNGSGVVILDVAKYEGNLRFPKQINIFPPFQHDK